MTDYTIPKKTRLMSLDFFRGITVAAMILVNNPGDWGNTYSPLKHAPWNGCTPTDLIFPFFLFIVGVSIAFALGSTKDDRAGHAGLLIKALKRALILFGLGLFLGYFPKMFTDPLGAFETLRIPGVLQRIAVVYFVTAIIFIKTQRKTQIVLIVFLLLGYWAVMTLVPVPGVGAANLEKGTNLAAWLDRTVLTENHLWKKSKTWDPEGILSTFPAVATGLLGLLTGGWLRRKDVEDSVKVSWMFSAGLLLAMAGLAWDLVFPLNKALWTSSFVLYTAGLAMMGLALSYWFIDANNRKKGIKPFIAFGSNAITVFFLSGLIPNILAMIKITKADGDIITAKGWIYENFIEPLFSPVNASLAYALVFLLLLFCLAWIMYRKNIIVKV